MYDDPLHGFLVGLKLFSEMMANLPEAHPGCLAASFAYQDQLFNREIRQLNAEGVLAWRQRFRERLDLIATRHPPRFEVDFDALADMAATLVEGALILGRLLNDVTIPPRQVLLYRDLVRSVFAHPPRQVRAPRRRLPLENRYASRAGSGGGSSGCHSASVARSPGPAASHLEETR